ncbi:MAG: hypothetical protein J5992_08935 [Oscillospiraceae bacterium]|nr:hypothetical protein [Oscillospiraceae bacterium]
MKKIKKMLVLVVSMTIILCGCDKVPSEDTPMTNRLFNVCAEIDYGKNSISCSMTRLGDGIWKSEIDSPSELEGVSISLSNNIIVTEYHGMTVANEKENLPENNLYLVLSECIDHSAKAVSLPYSETDDGKRIFTGECEKGKYEITVDENDNLCSLYVKDKDIKAEFSEFCVLE